jgi:glutathione S-transferase
MSEIILHGLSFSPYVRAVAMALDIKGLAYRHQEIEHRPGPGSLGSAEHLQLHPFGRVPILDDGDVRLYETQAILRYLDAKYPQSPLQPTEPRNIGRMNQAIGILDCYLFTQSIRPIGAQRVVRPNLMGMAPDEAIVAEALAPTQVCVTALAKVLGDDKFLAGDALTLADLMLAPQLHLLSPVPEVLAMLERTCLLDWLERMLALPAMVATAPPAGLKLLTSVRNLEAA